MDDQTLYPPPQQPPAAVPGWPGAAPGVAPRSTAGPVGGYATVYAPAPAWRNALAAVANLGILAVGEAIALSLVGNVVADAQVGTTGTPRLLVAAVVQALMVGGVVAFYLLGWRGGGTPGMRMLHLTLVDAASGDLPRTDQVLLRMAGGLWSTVLALAGLLWGAVAPDRRGWHDRLAGTVVLHGDVHPWFWQWDGARWAPSGAPAQPVVPQPTGRRPVAPSPERSRWTWTDALPIAVLQLPVAFVGQLAVVRATRAVGLGRPEPSVGSLILDVVGYGCVALLIWLFLGLRRRVSLADVGLRPMRWRWIAAAIPAAVIAYTAELVFGEIGDALLPASPANQCHDIQSAFGSSVVLGLIGVAVIAPLVEETLFRGVVFGWMRGRMPLWLAVVGSAAVFSLSHILYLQWNLLPPVFGIGCVLALLYHYSRSLWPGIVVHAIINTVATLVLLLGAVHC